MGEEQTEDWVGLLLGGGEVPIPRVLRKSLAMVAQYSTCCVS